MLVNHLKRNFLDCWVQKPEIDPISDGTQWPIVYCYVRQLLRKSLCELRTWVTSSKLSLSLFLTRKTSCFLTGRWTEHLIVVATLGRVVTGMETAGIKICHTVLCPFSIHQSWFKHPSDPVTSLTCNSICSFYLTSRWALDRRRSSR